VIDYPTLTTAPPPPPSSSAVPFTPSAPSYAGGYYAPYPVRQSPYGSQLQGMASLTSATGQYYKDIQSARITREQSRQASIDTQRKQLEWEMEYEKLRPTAPKMLDQERATDLDWARKGPPNSEIWSGQTLNVLLKSILLAPAPDKGDQILLSTTALSGLSLTDGTTRGNLGLAKDDGKIAWTEALDDASYDTERDRFSKNFQTAMAYANAGKEPERGVVRELKADLKRMEEKLDDQVRDLAPSRYIEARRLLNQLKDNIKGLSDPRLVKSCNNDWRKGVRTVGDLVTYCARNGLEFGPAVAPGDYPGYTAAYYSIRQYERSVQGQVVRR